LLSFENFAYRPPVDPLGGGMEVHHKPKPWRDWREFLKEYGIIVLGVLTALGAEQLVDQLHWRHKVDTVRMSLMGELSNDRARWDVDVMSAKCAQSDLKALEVWTQAGRGAPPPTPNITSVNLYWMHWANWNLATASQALDHFPLAEQLAFASLYDGVVHRQIEIEHASEAADRVQTLIPLADDPKGRRDLREAVGTLGAKMQAIAADDGYMLRHFDALKVQPDRRDFAADLDTTHCVS
jgi:hypothetical protein